MESLHFNKYEKIITLLGKVEAGFVIWFRAKKYGTPVSEILAQAIVCMKNFL